VGGPVELAPLLPACSRTTATCCHLPPRHAKFMESDPLLNLLPSSAPTHHSPLLPSARLPPAGRPSLWSLRRLVWSSWCSTKQQQPCISTGQHVVERLVLNRGTQNASGAFTSANFVQHTISVDEERNLCSGCNLQQRCRATCLYATLNHLLDIT
jgi:hypothetical protein